MSKKNKIKKSVTLDGLMTLGQLDDGRHTADFACCEDVQLEQVKGTFSVQIQRDGNVYMTENKKRIRNSPIFREDTLCSLLKMTASKTWLRSWCVRRKSLRRRS